jgi:hypothetical protein
MMTPEELAKKVNDINGDVVTDDSKQCLASYSATDIQRFIHATHFLNKPAHLELAKMALQVRISEDAVESARKMEGYTRWLIGLTIALVAFALFDFFRLIAEFCHNHICPP